MTTSKTPEITKFYLVDNYFLREVKDVDGRTYFLVKDLWVDNLAEELEYGFVSAVIWTQRPESVEEFYELMSNHRSQNFRL